MSSICGFDVEDWHTNATCNQKKQGHQRMASIAQITWNMNMTTIPSAAKTRTRQFTEAFLQCGVVNDVVLNSLTSVDFCYSLDPTHDYASLVATNDNPTNNNDVTVLASNCTTAHHAGAMLIKPSHVVANMGATSVFIMDGTPTKINGQPRIQFK
jgi:hypothetical protein